MNCPICDNSLINGNFLNQSNSKNRVDECPPCGYLRSTLIHDNSIVFEFVAFDEANISNSVNIDTGKMLSDILVKKTREIIKLDTPFCFDKNIYKRVKSLLMLI